MLTHLVLSIAGAFDFVSKLLVLNNYGGVREGLHGGSELVRLQSLVNVSQLF